MIFVQWRGVFALLWHRLRMHPDIGFAFTLTSASQYLDIGFALILTSASHYFAQIWFMHDRIWFMNMIACTVLEFAANSTCTCAGWVDVQVEFAASSKSMHAITFVFNLISLFCCFHGCRLSLRRDLSPRSNPSALSRGIDGSLD